MERGLRVAGWAAALIFVVVGVGELLLADGSLGHRLAFAAVLSLFAALVVVGVRLIDTRPGLERRWHRWARSPEGLPCSGRSRPASWPLPSSSSRCFALAGRQSRAFRPRKTRQTFGP